MNRNEPMYAPYALIFSLGLTMIALVVIIASYDTIECEAEDEIPITINEDSFNYEAGDKLCIHVDNLLQ